MVYYHNYQVDEPEVGKTIRHYKLLSFLGGRSYLALDLKTKRNVIFQNIGSDWHFNAKIIEKLKKLDHPNLIKILEWWNIGDASSYDSAYGATNPGACYLIKEYLQGKNLQYYLEKWKRFKPRQALDVMRNLINVIEYASHEKITWSYFTLKDIKINIEKKRIILKNFGIQPALVDLYKNYKYDMFKNDYDHIRYMDCYLVEDSRNKAPIYIMYYLGSLLYHMLTGLLPYKGCDGCGVMQILMKISSNAPITPIQELVALDNYVAEIVNRCMSPDLSRRFTSYQELSESIHQAKLGTKIELNDEGSKIE